MNHKAFGASFLCWVYFILDKSQFQVLTSKKSDKIKAPYINFYKWHKHNAFIFSEFLLVGTKNWYLYNFFFFWTKITKSSHWLELGKGIFQSAMTMFWSSSSTFFKLSRQTNSCQLLLLSISIVRVSIKWVYLFSNRSLSWAQLISNSFFRLNFGDSTSELAWASVLVVIVSAIFR